MWALLHMGHFPATWFDGGLLRRLHAQLPTMNAVDAAMTLEALAAWQGEGLAAMGGAQALQVVVRAACERLLAISGVAVAPAAPRAASRSGGSSGGGGGVSASSPARPGSPRAASGGSASPRAASGGSASPRVASGGASPRAAALGARSGLGLGAASRVGSPVDPLAAARQLPLQPARLRKLLAALALLQQRREPLLAQLLVRQLAGSQDELSARQLLFCVRAALQLRHDPGPLLEALLGRMQAQGEEAPLELALGALRACAEAGRQPGEVALGTLVAAIERGLEEATAAAPDVGSSGGSEGGGGGGGGDLLEMAAQELFGDDYGSSGGGGSGAAGLPLLPLASALHSLMLLQQLASPPARRLAARLLPGQQPGSAAGYDSDGASSSGPRSDASSSGPRSDASSSGPRSDGSSSGPRSDGSSPLLLHPQLPECSQLLGGCLLAAQAGRLLDTPWARLPRDVKARLVEGWRRDALVRSKRRPGMVQLQLLAALQRLGLRGRAYECTPDGCLVVDVLLRQPGGGLAALEVLGPHNSLAGGGGSSSGSDSSSGSSSDERGSGSSGGIRRRPTAAALLKWRLLQARGVQVVVIDAWQWLELGRADPLERLLVLQERLRLSGRRREARRGRREAGPAAEQEPEQEGEADEAAQADEG
jgi:hypothetical protein